MMERCKTKLLLLNSSKNSSPSSGGSGSKFLRFGLTLIIDFKFGFNGFETFKSVQVWAHWVYEISLVSGRVFLGLMGIELKNGHFSTLDIG